MHEKEEIQYGELVIEGDKYKTILTQKYLNRPKYVPFNPKLVKAVIPGTIVKILTRKGRKIEVGESLLIIEAMKMQTHITAHIAGKIKVVHVKMGQMVAKNFVMIELE